MRYYELIAERAPSPKTRFPDTVTDLRDPSAAPTNRDGGPDLPCIALTKDGGAIVYYRSGSGNALPWQEVLAKVRAEKDMALSPEDDHALRFFEDGILIGRDREFAEWKGERNRYSEDLKPIVRALMDRGLAKPTTPIYLGGPRNDDAEELGSAAAVLRAASTPNALILYHGTSTARWSIIQKVGLKPMDFDERVWNATSLDKVRPQHREESIYLTSSQTQAWSYARKAVEIDRKRLGPQARRQAQKTVASATQEIQGLRRQLEDYRALTPEQIARRDEHARRYDSRASTIASQIAYIPHRIAQLEQILKTNRFAASIEQDGPIKPIMLTVTLTRAEYKRLMADDDHLRINAGADEKDWRGSLGQFAQIAYQGSIPPERLKVVTNPKVW